MPEMTDQEFIQSFKDCYGLDMSDDEVVERHNEIENSFDVGFDQSKYDFGWQDPNRRPNLVSKGELAEIMDVSLKTIDDWERKGMPIYRHGGHGIPFPIHSGAGF